MQQLSKYDIQALAVESFPKWRPLECARYHYHFISPDPMPVLEALDAYQNPDGGYGHGLEPDFWLPDSSPMATSVALAILSELMPTDPVLERIEKALDYLGRTYDARKMGWTSVPKKVAEYPHAPWWHSGDGQWGNPTMELIGYFLKWHPEVGEQRFKDQLDFGEKHLMGMDPDHYEAHEIYCYLRAYPYLSGHRQLRLYSTLDKAIHQLMEDKPEAWQTYVPRPLDFVPHPREERFGIKPEHLTAQLNYLSHHLLTHKRLEPTWTWEPWPGLEPSHYWPQWQRDWPIAKAQWEGVLTLKGLLQLKEFGWIR